MRVPWRKAEAQQEGRTCPNCKAPLAEEQDWCVQCGEHVSGDLRSRAGWFSAGLLAATSVTLVSGAAAAGIAALTQSPTKEPPHKLLVVKRLPVVTGAAEPGQPETVEATTTAGEPTSEAAGSSSEAATPPSTAGPAAPPRRAATPAPSPTRGAPAEATTTTMAGREPLELQGYMLSNYDPHETYPSEDLNSPRQAFEEGSPTLWEVTIHPGGSRKVGVGLVVDLQKPQAVSAVELRTPTPGFQAEILGAGEGPLPPSRSSNRWTVLARLKKVGPTATVTLAHAGQPFRYILLWVTEVPPKLAGTRSRPGRLKLEELALYPPS